MEAVGPSLKDRLVSTELIVTVCNDEMIESDEEAQVFAVKRRKSRLIVRDDSSEEQDLDRESNSSETRESGSEEVTDVDQIHAKKRKKKKIIRPVEDSDSEIDTLASADAKTSSVKERLVMLADTRSSKNDETSDTNREELAYLECRTRQLLTDNDLYDAESSSGDDRNVNDADDEGLESLDNIKKRAKKSLTTKKRPPKLKRSDLQQLHSESQRIVREGRIKLPYHVPQAKTLDEFLGRRKSIPNTLKPADCDLMNIFRVEDKEQKTSFPHVELESEIRNLSSNSEQINGENAHSESLVPDNVAFGTVLNSDGVLSEFRTIKELPDLTFDLVTEESQHEAQIAVASDPQLLNRSKEPLIRDITKEVAVKKPSSLSSGLKQRLSLLGSDVASLTPKLAGIPREIICLDDDDDTTKQNSGLGDLIKRFVKHTTFVKRNQQLVGTKEVVLNILKKETDSNGQEQLKMESVKVNSKPIEEPVFDDLPPGSHMKLLRENLKAQLAFKREEARKQRLHLHDIDNERDGVAGFDSDDENGKGEDEEEILSDLTDTEESETDEEEDDELNYLPEKRKEKSQFVDDEAEDEDEISDDYDKEDDDEANDSVSCVQESKMPREPSLARCDTIELFPLSLSRSEECQPKADQSVNSLLDNSFDLNSCSIPAYQPGGGFLRRKELDSFSQATKTNFPIEDSQSLYSQTGPDNSEPASSCQTFEFSQFEKLDTQSTQSQSSISKKLGFGESQSQNNMDELFDLCSGKWADERHRDDNLGVTLLCNPQSQNTQENEAELFRLCSGKFCSISIGDPLLSSESTVQDAFESCNARERQISLAENAISDDELSISSLQSETVGHHRRKKVKRVLSDSESESDEREEDIKEDSEEEESKRREANEFFEDEAELSGSDVPSDEDEDINEEDDILEEELGDQDYISEDELRNQVEKVHNKLMLDEDQRQLRIYKELYLEDGELHTDGQGRTRRFRWRNVGSLQTDDGVKMSDSEGEDVVEEGVDAEFRIQRHEREKWLTEQSMNNNDDPDENHSQFGQITKKVTILSRHNSQVCEGPLAEQSTNKRLISLRRGSFLSRSKEILAKIVEQTKSSDKSNPNGPRNTRNFVFARLSPVKSDSKPPRPQLRRASSTPASKRMRFDKRSSLNPDDQSHDNSIFHLLL